MPARLLAWAEFEALAAEILARGSQVRFEARGASMRPFIQDGDLVTIQAVEAGSVKKGDILLARMNGGRLVVHRARQVTPAFVLIQGDAVMDPDGRLSLSSILGRVTAVERAGRPVHFNHGMQRFLSAAWLVAAPVRRQLFGLMRFCYHILRKGKKEPIPSPTCPFGHPKRVPKGEKRTDREL
jgi:signal peptidase I